MVDEVLNEDQSRALMHEIDSTRNTLAYGLRVVRSDALFDNIRDPVLAMLSIGVERLYKLTLGLAELDEYGRWPSVGAMRKHGHGVRRMHDAVWPTLRQRAGANTFVGQLLEEVDRDPVLLPVVDCLDMYGLQGRFYFLDVLAGDPQPRDAPRRFWISVEVAALDSDHELRRLRSMVKANPVNKDADAALRLALRTCIALSIEQAWATIAQCGRMGLLGPAGRLFGREIQPGSVGRQ